MNRHVFAPIIPSENHITDIPLDLDILNKTKERNHHSSSQKNEDFIGT